MYIPPSFNVEDPDKIAEFIRQHSFATLVTTDDRHVPFASHLPILCENQDDDKFVLLAHMARANPQWKQFGHDRELLAIFQGPHAYVSPSWYVSTVAVPTWNYAAVHVYGLPRLISNGAELEELLAKTVATYERPFAKPWTNQNEPDLHEKLKQAIVGFEIDVTRIEAKFKLNQNRSAEDVKGVYEVLSQSTDQTQRELADLMYREVVAK